MLIFLLKLNYELKIFTFYLYKGNFEILIDMLMIRFKYNALILLKWFEIWNYNFQTLMSKRINNICMFYNLLYFIM